MLITDPALIMMLSENLPPGCSRYYHLVALLTTDDQLLWCRRGLLNQALVHIHDHFVLIDNFSLSQSIVILILELKCERILHFQWVELMSFLRFLCMDSLSYPLNQLWRDTWVLAEMDGTDAHCLSKTVSDLKYLL